MDKFVVDIDAVLDEFEESENKIQPQITALPQIKHQKPVVAVAAPPTPPAAPSPTPATPPACEPPPSLELEPDAPVEVVKLNGTKEREEISESQNETITEPKVEETPEPALLDVSGPVLVEPSPEAPQNTSLETPPPSLVETPETTFVEAPETAPVEAPETASLEAPETASVESPETALVEAPETKLVEVPETTLVDVSVFEPVANLEPEVVETLEPGPGTTLESKSIPPPVPKPVESSPAVKPKTPLKTPSTPSSNRTTSPGVSSEQFEEFLRKKSIENAHLLSAHNSPVLQRYRSPSSGKAAPPVAATPKSLEQCDVIPRSEPARKLSQSQGGASEEGDAQSKPERPESDAQVSEGVPCSTTQSTSGDLPKALPRDEPESEISDACESAEQSRPPDELDEVLRVEEERVEVLNGAHDAQVNHSAPTPQAREDSINHGPLKSDASNFYRIVSFDMSAVEVTDEDLHLLEDEVHNDRAPSRRSQDSGASVEPVDPDQVIESEAAENVVNNNSTEASDPIENLDNPFAVPSKPQVAVPVHSADQSDNYSPETPSGDVTTDCTAAEHDVGIDEEAAQETPKPDSAACDQDAAVNSDEAEQGAVGGESEPVVAPGEGVLGKVRPMWIHDEDAPICMNCGQDFTIFRRRHHCRACGKVLCGNCCKDRARLQFMDGELARVCSYCIEILNKVERWSRPDPSNPMEYCSTVSPLAQMSSTAQLPPPTVMVPVGVLKKGGEKSNTSGSGIGGSSGCSKSVMFSDGIRPGGDLTDLDIPSTPPAQRAPQRTLKQLATGRSKAVVARKYRKYVSVTDSLGCLPNVLLSTKFKPYDQPLAAGTLFNLLQDPTLPPVSFELTRHKVQLRVKIVTLDCCLGSRVWSFCSEGLAAFGQEEVAFVLEYHTDDELAVPRDVLKLYKILYENACRGAPVIQMDHLLFPGGLLSSNEHAGVLFLRTTLQCTQNILTPLHENNYLVAMLILRSEVPWAKLFPLRLLLRLGAEFRYYPCPLVSQRFRKAVYFEGDQHSIMSILADFRNYQYTIQNIPGLVIHVVGKTYTIKAPRNRYDLMMKASTTNENILAIGSNFSSTADSHLVCIQGEDGSFQSQTINIASLPVKVTGASFLVFSGALKSNSGYTAKSSIVEDGILVQIGPHDMSKLKQAIHAMENYRIVCKETKPTTETTEAAEEEYVELLWVENEVTRNESVISVVDGSSMAGIPSCKIFSGTDYSNEKFVVRWTELFFLASKDTELDLPDPNRLIEATARSMCVALLPHAAKLYERDLKKVALRISLDPEQFGYELGAGGERLNGEFLSEVDNALVPIITSLDGSHQPMTIELVFYVLLK